MQTPQRILGLIVVKFRDSTDGAPSGGCMAVFTRNRQGSVRTSSGLPLCGRHRCPSWQPSEKQQPTQNFDHSERICPLPRSVPVGWRYSGWIYLNFPRLKESRQLYAWPVIGHDLRLVNCVLHHACDLAGARNHWCIRLATSCPTSQFQVSRNLI